MRKHLLASSLFALALGFSGVAAAGSPSTQQPFTGAEFNKFLTDYSAAATWLAEQKKGQRLVRNPWVLTGMRYNPEFVKHLQEMGWDSDRFFYLLDHINMGLLSSRAEENRANAQVRMDERMEQMKARMDEGRKRMEEGRQRMDEGRQRMDEGEKRMQDAQQKMQERMRTQQAAVQANRLKQLAAQRARIQNIPYMPPQEKQRMLAQLERDMKQASSAPATAANPEQARQTMAQQQQEWMANQERMIRNNPYMPPAQKRMALANIGRARQQQSQPAMPAHPGPVDFEKMAARSEAQQRLMLDMHRKRISENPYFPADQKKQMLARIEGMAQRMEAKPEAAPASSGLVPDAEMALIRENHKKLLEVFFPEK